jgi:AraC family transcriptional regulator
MPAFSSMRIAAYQGIGAMAPHSHEAPVLCLPLGGAYVERTRGRETEHRLGDILLCPANEPHAQQFGAARVTKLLLHPTAETMDYLSSFIRVREAPYERVRTLEGLAARLAGEISGADPQSALIAEGLGLQVLGLFARAGERERGLPRWLEAARDYVRLNCDSVLRLDEVAAHAGCRAPQLAAAYRRAFGCTIGEDARAIRLERAAASLATTAEPIAGIAVDCGFYDQPHFTRAFRKAYGLTPLAYRRRLH